MPAARQGMHVEFALFEGDRLLYRGVPFLKPGEGFSRFGGHRHFSIQVHTAELTSHD